jgi:hypothetical protein
METATEIRRKQQESADLMRRLRAITPRLPADDEWRDLAACRDTDPSIFFPEAVGGSPRTTGGMNAAEMAQYETARRICIECPVRPECLGDALAGREYGVRAGLTVSQRRAFAREWWWLRCNRCHKITRKSSLGKAGAAQRYCGPCVAENVLDQKAEHMRRVRAS